MDPQPNLPTQNIASTLRAAIAAVGAVGVAFGFCTPTQIASLQTSLGPILEVAGPVLLIAAPVWAYFKNHNSKKALVAAIAAPAGKAA